MTGASGLGISAKKITALVSTSESAIHYRGVQYDCGPTESLELHERTGVVEDPNI